MKTLLENKDLITKTGITLSTAIIAKVDLLVLGFLSTGASNAIQDASAIIALLVGLFTLGKLILGGYRSIKNTDEK